MSERDGELLVQRVRATLLRAGFAAEATPPALTKGLVLAHEAGRGVVVSWASAAQPLATETRYLREAHATVQLALHAALARDGFAVCCDRFSGEVIVTSMPRGNGPQ
ncbi:hypothetical protein [Nonomuraea basaltis]|uniref:hypothetical protein n=1 Tax=Nonomuraea basaltis TaxID=2495887 RepID=UPI00110C6150|nr:hypothetical protein [Nonomuraea basaltis]TMR99790.1 hypothetical protein EJK15_05860 [Nonomuraea basaltis]